MAANVVDFPLPVTPVTKTKPLCRFANSVITEGSFNSSIDKIFYRNNS